MGSDALQSCWTATAAYHQVSVNITCGLTVWRPGSDPAFYS